MKLIALLFLFSFINSCGQKEWDDKSDKGEKPVSQDKGNNKQDEELNNKRKKAFCEVYDAIGTCTQKASIEQITLCLENDVVLSLETKMGEKEIEVSTIQKKEIDSSSGTLIKQCISGEMDLDSFRNCMKTFVSKGKNIIGCN